MFAPKCALVLRDMYASRNIQFRLDHWRVGGRGGGRLYAISTGLARGEIDILFLCVLQCFPETEINKQALECISIFQLYQSISIHLELALFHTAINAKLQNDWNKLYFIDSGKY